MGAQRCQGAQTHRRTPALPLARPKWWGSPGVRGPDLCPAVVCLANNGLINGPRHSSAPHLSPWSSWDPCGMPRLAGCLQQLAPEPSAPRPSHSLQFKGGCKELLPIFSGGRPPGQVPVAGGASSTRPWESKRDAPKPRTQYASQDLPATAPENFVAGAGGAEMPGGNATRRQ